MSQTTIQTTTHQKTLIQSFLNRASLDDVDISAADLEPANEWRSVECQYYRQHPDYISEHDESESCKYCDFTVTHHIIELTGRKFAVHKYDQSKNGVTNTWHEILRHQKDHHPETLVRIKGNKRITFNVLSEVEYLRKMMTAEAYEQAVQELEQEHEEIRQIEEGLA